MTGARWVFELDTDECIAVFDGQLLQVVHRVDRPDPAELRADATERRLKAAEWRDKAHKITDPDAAAERERWAEAAARAEREADDADDEAATVEAELEELGDTEELLRACVVNRDAALRELRAFGADRDDLERSEAAL